MSDDLDPARGFLLCAFLGMAFYMALFLVSA